MLRAHMHAPTSELGHIECDQSSWLRLAAYTVVKSCGLGSVHLIPAPAFGPVAHGSSSQPAVQNPRPEHRLSEPQITGEYPRVLVKSPLHMADPEVVKAGQPARLKWFISEAETEEDWEFVKEERTVRIFRKPILNENTHRFRGAVRIKKPVNEIVQYLSDAKARPEFDQMCEGMTEIAQYGKNMVLCYAVFNSPWPTAWRDFIMGYHVGEREDKPGHWFGMGWNEEHPEYPPKVGEDKGYVRGSIEPCGFLVSPAAGNPDTESDVVYTSYLDPRGWLPAWVINLVAVNQPMIVGKLKEIMESR